MDMHAAAARVALTASLALAGAACSPFGGDVDTTISVACPEHLVTVEKGERPAKPVPVVNNFADLSAYAEALGVYADRMELQARAREEQVAECRELAED